MKKTIILSLMMVLFSVSFLSAAEKYSYKPENGYVPDQVTAVKIAEAVLIPIYSEKTTADEKPLKAELKG